MLYNGVECLSRNVGLFILGDNPCVLSRISRIVQSENLNSLSLGPTVNNVQGCRNYP